MVLEIENLKYILDNCKDVFEKEPVLELTMCLVFQNALIGRIQHSSIDVCKRWALPFYLVVKKNRIKKKHVHIFLNDADNKKSYGVFGIGMSRDNDFGCIFPVLKKMDTIGEKSILFTNYEVYMVKKEEIDSLTHNTLIFFNDMYQYVSFQEIFHSFIQARKLYEKLTIETKNKKILDFEITYKNILISTLSILLVDTTSICNILKNKKCRFLFSLGRPVFGAVGRKLGIRTLMIQHGIHMDISSNIQYSPHNSDEIIVWGKEPINQVKKLIGENHKIIDLGNPQYDLMIIEESKKQKSESERIINKFNIDKNKKNLVFFSTTHFIDSGLPKDKYIQPIHSLNKLFKKFGEEINIIIKLHPNEDKKYYKEILGNNYKRFIYLKNEIKLNDLYKITDIAISTDSTTLLEAMIFNIPTIQLGLTKYGVISDYYKHGASILIKNQEEFEMIIKKILNQEFDLIELEKNKDKYLKNYLGEVGNSTEKIINHLLS